MSKALPNRGYVSGAQFRWPMVFPFSASRAPLENSVCNIVSIGPEKEMRRVYAPTVVTFVQDMKRAWRSVDEYPGNAVRLNASTQLKAAIAVGIEPCDPVPTGIISCL